MSRSLSGDWLRAPSRPRSRLCRGRGRLDPGGTAVAIRSAGSRMIRRDLVGGNAIPVGDCQQERGTGSSCSLVECLVTGEASLASAQVGQRDVVGHAAMGAGDVGHISEHGSRRGVNLGPCVRANIVSSDIDLGSVCAPLGRSACGGQPRSGSGSISSTWSTASLENRTSFTSCSARR